MITSIDCLLFTFMPSQSTVRFVIFSGDRGRAWHFEMVRHVLQFKRNLKDYWKKIELQLCRHVSNQFIWKVHKQSFIAVNTVILTSYLLVKYQNFFFSVKQSRATF